MLALSACPIPPDNFDAGTLDGGPDAGATTSDGGSADAGSLASGTISCMVGTSTQLAQLAEWTDADLAGTTSLQPGDGTTTVSLSGQNANSGQIALGISGLTPGTQAGTLVTAGYASPSGQSQDQWSCTTTAQCSATFSVQAFDGVNLAGTFQIQFFSNASTSGAQAASLSNGSFRVVLPQ